MDLSTVQVGTLKVGPQDTADCPFDLGHPFCQSAALLWNSSSLKNYAPNAAPVSPTFDSSAVFFRQDAIGRCVRKGTADDGKGVNFGSYAPLQISVGTWVFLFSVDSVSVFTNIFTSSAPGGATGLLMRISNAGKVQLQKVNTVDFYTGSITLVAGALYCVAFSYSGATGAGNVAVNGRLDTAVASSQTFTYDTVRLQSAGFAGFDGKSRLWLAAIKPTLSTKEELISLSANPWQLLNEEVDLFVNLRTAAVVTGKVPWPILMNRRAA